LLLYCKIRKACIVCNWQLRCWWFCEQCSDDWLLLNICADNCTCVCNVVMFSPAGSAVSGDGRHHSEACPVQRLLRRTQLLWPRYSQVT